MTPVNVIKLLQELNSYIISLGRLNYVELLLDESIDSKLLNAQNGHILIDQACNIELVLCKYLNQKKRTIKWDNVTIKTINLAIASQDIQIICQLKDKYEECCSKILNSIKNNFIGDLLIYQLTNCLNSLFHIFCRNKKLNSEKLIPIDTIGKGNISKVLYGPSKMKTDKIFEPSYNIIDNSVPEFGDSLEEIVPYFWSLSLREILASELCALSLIEYDNLPLQFFWDFSKQSWDEARHSRIYLDLSISYFDKIKNNIGLDDNLRNIIIYYQAHQRGLPVPYEKNMYEAIVNAELEERVILMNILTEAPSIGRLNRKINRSICVQYPEIKRTLEFDKIDEIFHARIGNYWLKYIIPDNIERKKKTADTKLLRGFLLLTSISEYSELSLNEMALSVI